MPILESFTDQADGVIGDEDSFVEVAGCACGARFSSVQAAIEHECVFDEMAPFDTESCSACGAFHPGEACDFV